MRSKHGHRWPLTFVLGKAMISDCTAMRKQKSEEKYPQFTAFILYKRFI